MKISNTDCQLFEIDKREQVRISWHGSEESFKHNKRHLLNALGNGTLQWKRENKSQNLPLHLRFTPLLVPFNANTSICPTSNSFSDHSTETDFAFVHLFFVNSGNFEEYRLTVRPEISEWFATLNEANENHWLILFDCAKVSRDKKAKSQLTDKLKSDFSRFQSRIFEFVDLSSDKSFATFSVLLQSNLFASFELYVANLSANARKLKECLRETSFGLHFLVNEQFRLSRFYWNLGLLEVALAELDALAFLLSDSIKIWCQNENAELSPQWVKNLRLLPLGRHCTLLGIQMCLNTVEEDLSLVKIHAHLLAHQFVLSAQNLQNRLNLAAVHAGVASSPSPIDRFHSQPTSPHIKPKMIDKALEEEAKMGEKTAQGQKERQLNTLQLRHNTVTTVLGYARETIGRFEEHILMLRANRNVTIFHCLILVWLAELSKYCEHLLGDNEASKLCAVTSATVHLNILLFKKCEAIRHLCTALLRVDTLCNNLGSPNQSLAVLRRWLDATPLNVPSLNGSFFRTSPTNSYTFSAPSSSSTSSSVHHSALADESARLFRVFSQMICGAIDGGVSAKAWKLFAEWALVDALESFDRCGWWRNAFFARQQLAELIMHSSPTQAHVHFRHNLAIVLSRCSLAGLSQLNSDMLEDLIKHFEETTDQKGTELSKILFGCCFVVLSLVDWSNSENKEDEIERWHSKLARERKTAEKGERSAILMRWPPADCEPSRAASMPVSFGPVPLAVVHVRRPPSASSPFIRCSSNRSSASVIVGLHNSLAVPLNDCYVKALFRRFSENNSVSKSTLDSFHITGPKEKGGPFSLERFSIKNVKHPLENCDRNPFFVLHQTQPSSITLDSKSTANCTLALQKIHINGIFFLDSIFVTNNEFGVEFVLDYQQEMAKNNKLKDLFYCVVGVGPNIQLKCIDSDGTEMCVDDVTPPHFVSGIEQLFALEVSSGTSSLPAPSHLALSLLAHCSDGPVQFLNFDGNWSTTAQFPIPPLDEETNHRILVRMFKGIGRLDAQLKGSQSEAIGAQIEQNVEVLVEWSTDTLFADQSMQNSALIARRTFPITFRPLMSFSWHTSFLAHRTLFHLCISRKNCASSVAALSVDVQPIFVSLSAQQSKETENACELLNPTPLKPIVPNSIFHFIWRLSEPSSTDHTGVGTHFFELKYNVKKRHPKSEKSDGIVQQVDGRDGMDEHSQRDGMDEHSQRDGMDKHSLTFRIQIPPQKIDYELCARFFSEQSQSVLCRVGQSADFVVSLRSLSNTLSDAETLIVSIEPDNSATGHFWHCAERHKLARVKESGVGQAIFTVVPKQLGFLPFPSISLHRLNDFDTSSSRNPSVLNEKCFGERLLVSYRNMGSQINILGPLHGLPEETASLSSANTTESTEVKKKSLRTVAKDRLQKLFE